jgi:hypothetical protein
MQAQVLHTACVEPHRTPSGQRPCTPLTLHLLTSQLLSPLARPLQLLEMLHKEHLSR